ncbi:MAG TPA: glycosyltransferase family 2 protein [Thermoplasmata archaeon]|nr:glycosyltransferase family 2 protein [Thermoplasmata archaeon]HTW77427.1 glycosyltransferase family 2 protein [Thermoplasmata archaeon]
MTSPAPPMPAPAVDALEEPPRISVVVIAHERPTYLGEALRSVSAQQIPEGRVEKILVKNFHDTATDALCVELGVENIFCGEQSATLKVRTGLHACRAPIITMLDYDDRYRAGRLARVLGEFRANPQLGFFRNGMAVIDGSGAPFPPRELPLSLAWMGRHRRILLRDADKGHTSPRLHASRPDFCVSTMAWRREVSADLDPYWNRLKFSADSLLFAAAWASPYDLVIEPTRLTEYRIHGANVSGVARGGAAITPQREAWERQRTSDLEVLEQFAAQHDRPELLLDLRLRSYRDRVARRLGAPEAHRADARALAAELPSLLQPPTSVGLLLQSSVCLGASFLSPSLGRWVASHTT